MILTSMTIIVSCNNDELLPDRREEWDDSSLGEVCSGFKDSMLRTARDQVFLRFPPELGCEVLLAEQFDD
jgi:hypothetical protein